MIENRAVFTALSFWVTYGNVNYMRRNRRRLAPVALAAILSSTAAEAAVIIPTASGGWATMAAITSVDTAKIVGSLRWTDALGNVKTATGVAVRPQIGAAASLARGILARRLVVGATVAALLYETLSTKLAPGTQISADGTPQVVVAGTPVTACTMSYIKVPALGTSSPTVSAFGYLPCAYSSTAPTRLIIRVPVNSSWQPSAEWLNQYGTSSRTTRQLPFVLQGGDHADTTTGFYEYQRPQPTSSVDVPTSSVTAMSEAEQAALLMDPAVIGPLASADAIPPNFFQPVDLATATNPDNTTDDGSELPDGPTVDDVDAEIFNIMKFVPDLSTRWLPLEIDMPSLYLQGRYDWPNEKFCAVATTYISPVMQIAGLALFLAIVFRKFQGGA